MDQRVSKYMQQLTSRGRSLKGKQNKKKTFKERTRAKIVLVEFQNGKLLLRASLQW